MRPKFPLSIILAALPFVFSLNPLFVQQKPALAAQFTELADPTKDVNSDWSRVKPGLHASFGSIDRRYPKSVAPSLTIKQQEQLEGWRGERVSAQILLWSSTPLKNIQIEISDFRSDKGPVLPANIAEARFVRYVMTDEFAAGCGHRKPEDFAASLSPDMLDDLKSMDIDAKTARPVWITVNIPREAAKGNYTAKVKVKADAQKTWESSLKVEVIDQVLPPASEWSFHLDQWQHPSAVARVEGLEMWSDAHFEALKPVMQRLADAGQKVITATINKDPWNVQTYDPYADMISWTKQKNGAWHYNYQVFDRWVEFMMGLGIKDMLNCYSIVPWNNEIHYTDEATGKLVNVVAKPGTAIFEELWTPFLTDFVKHLESKGWLEITNIAMDEREREQMDAALALLKKVSPKLGVSYADNQKTYQRYPDSDDISISAQHPFSQQDLKDRKQRGLNTTFYICCSDGFPNQFTFSDPAESTYLGWYAQATGFDGMLRWAFNSWVENPLQDSRFRTWPAGDTYIVYPKGRSSIRYERMLEGIQDFEKVRIVSEALNIKAHSNELSELNKAIEKFKSVERTDHWNADLNQAKSLLNKISKSIY